MVWLYRTTWFVLPAILIALALPHFVSGLVFESAFPIPAYLAMNVRLPTRSYRTGALRLSKTDKRDGNSKISQAEAGIAAGELAQSMMPVLEDGLSASPSSGRGWMILAELLTPIDSRRAAEALKLSVELDGHDYWIISRRLQDAAKLWKDMGGVGREAALEQARLMWTVPLLRAQMKSVIESPDGAKLVTRAFARDFDTLRAINRARYQTWQYRTPNLADSKSGP